MHYLPTIIMILLSLHPKLHATENILEWTVNSSLSKCSLVTGELGDCNYSKNIGWEGMDNQPLIDKWNEDSLRMSSSNGEESTKRHSVYFTEWQLQGNSIISLTSSYLSFSFIWLSSSDGSGR